MTTKFQKARLLKLADLLEADAKNKKGLKFDLCLLGVVDDATDPVSCGTQACAMGLAAMSGAFKRSAGLSYKLDGVGIDTTINGRVTRFDLAAKRTFGISSREAFFLFGPAYYPDAKLSGAVGERFVAKRIRTFVKDRSIAA